MFCYQQKEYFTSSDPHRGILDNCQEFIRSDIYSDILLIFFLAFHLAFYLTFYLASFLDLFGILSDRYSDLLSGNISEKHYHSLSDIYSDILSGIISDIYSHVLVLSSILLSGLCSGPCLPRLSSSWRGAGEALVVSPRSVGGEERTGEELHLC